MSFITGLLLVDAPASALNNAGANEAARTDNAVATKLIPTARGAIPYVSAQAFRYWLRTTLEKDPESSWRAAPIYREAKVAYTDANPLIWWDDDLFGYMRAPSKRADAVERRQADPSRATETPTSTEITRVSPFRVSTLVGLTPRRPIDDFGTMSRHDGDPVPHEHQFYRAVLKGLISLDLNASGTFSYRNRTGYRNLDNNRRVEADGMVEGGQAQHLPDLQSYRLLDQERARRVSALLKGIGVLDGGAKQALHYTDVSPVVLIATVTRGGNNPLQYAIAGDQDGTPRVNVEALREMARVWNDQILSPLYVGWVQGFHDAERERLSTALEELAKGDEKIRLPQGHVLAHPREIASRLGSDLGNNVAAWMA